MSMDVTRITQDQSVADRMQSSLRRTAQEAVAAQKADRPKPEVPEIKVVTSELQTVANLLNRRLKFSINEDLGQVVVRVIDTRTDKVIKELPPEALQRLHVKIREAVGLLIDEQI
jgi:flagellar protein FlaG